MGILSTVSVTHKFFHRRNWYLAVLPCDAGYDVCGTNSVIPTLPISVITHHGVFIPTGRPNRTVHPDRAISRTTGHQPRVSRNRPFSYLRAYLRVPLHRFFYKPVTLTALAVALAALGYVAMTQDVLEEGRDKRRMYALSLRFALLGIVVNHHHYAGARMLPSPASLCFQ